MRAAAVAGQCARQGTDLDTIEGLFDLGRGLPALLAAGDEVRRLIHREAQLATIQLDQPSQRHALHRERLLGEVGDDASERDAAAAEHIAARAGEDGKDVWRAAGRAARRLERVPLAGRALEELAVHLHQLSPQQLESIIRLVAHETPSQAQVAQVAAPDVDRIVHDECHALVADHAREGFVLP